MNHPYELLADLVDGTLDEGDLAGVQAHLDSCASCRRDVDDATAGSRAARSLPVEDPPADLHRRVVGAGSGRSAPSWYRWAAAAAAAATVVAIAIALPDVGDGSKEEAGGVAADTTSAPEFSAGTGDVVVSQEDKDYDAQALEDLAKSATAARSETAPNAAGAAALDATTGVRCVAQAFDGRPPGRLTRLIRARFEGEEAYIAVYLEGPGAGEPPDTATVWAASSESCMVLSFASAPA
jgi:Putative zinc-finger